MLPFVTRTASLKSVSSLETKSSVSSNHTVRFYHSSSSYTHTLTFFCFSSFSYVAIFFASFIILHIPFCLGIGLGPSIPEDLWHLIKKAVAVRKHLEINRKDKDSKFRLILIESRIHRLARYYKTNQKLAPTFKYDAATASTLIA